MMKSMTGFSTRTFEFQRKKYRLTARSVNHKYLEVKVRSPKDWNFFEQDLKGIVEAQVKRGVVEFSCETEANSGADVFLNEAVLDSAYALMSGLKRRYAFEGGITIRDLISFPDVLQKTAPQKTENEAEELKKIVLSEAMLLVSDLNQARTEEGQKLSNALVEILEKITTSRCVLQNYREKNAQRNKEKIAKRIEQCFSAYPTTDSQMRAVLESRIAQEIALYLEKSDTEEELTRIDSHLVALKKMIAEGGVLGKKIEFYFQELSREINTLGSKSQDFETSEEVVKLKLWVDQMREQSMNVE